MPGRAERAPSRWSSPGGNPFPAWYLPAHISGAQLQHSCIPWQAPRRSSGQTAHTVPESEKWSRLTYPVSSDIRGWLYNRVWNSSVCVFQWVTPVFFQRRKKMWCLCLPFCLHPRKKHFSGLWIFCFRPGISSWSQYRGWEDPQTRLRNTDHISWSP